MTAAVTAPAAAAAAQGDAHARWRKARNILVIRLDNLGDLLMTTPALATIKQSRPDAKLTLLTSPAGAQALQYLPVIDDLILCTAPWHKHPPGGTPVDAAFIGELAARRFDAAIVFTVCTQSALPAAMMCHLAGIPLRLAYCRENPYELLTDWMPERDVCAPGMRHEVTRQLDLVKSVGFESQWEHLLFRYSAGDARHMKRKFEQAGGDVLRPYIVIHPGASAPSRRYPAERFGLAADALADATGCQIVFTAGEGEAPLVEQARSAMRNDSLSLTGELALGELAALIAGAQLVICNNSAPSHLAAALGTPVVVLYALTNPQHTPWMRRARVLNHEVPCRDCLKSTCPEHHHDCLMRVEPRQVVDAALELIGTLPAVPLHPRVAQSTNLEEAHP